MKKRTTTQQLKDANVQNFLTILATLGMDPSFDSIDEDELQEEYNEFLDADNDMPDGSSYAVYLEDTDHDAYWQGYSNWLDSLLGDVYVEINGEYYNQDALDTIYEEVTNEIESLLDNVLVMC